MFKLNKFKINFLLYLFPLVILSRSLTLNLYIVFLGLVFLYYYFAKNETYDKEFKNIIYSFFVLYFYLLLLSFFSTDKFLSFKSSASQIRFFLFFLFFSTVLKWDENFLSKLIFFYKLILLIFSLDLIFQSLNANHYNSIGLISGGSDPKRFSGFFGDELIAGTFIYFLAIPVISQIFSKFNSDNLARKIINIFFITVVTIAIVVTGDRMASILYISSIILIVLFFFDYKKIIIFFAIMGIFLVTIFQFNSTVQTRYKETILEVKNYKEFGYFQLFSSSFSIWQNNKIFGIGLKNYRIVCDTKTQDKYTGKATLCSTHPHNNWLELLVETGLVGITFFVIFIVNIAKYIYLKRANFISKNYTYRGYVLGLLITLLFFLWPIKSSGSMFGTSFMTYVWFNLGILFSLIKSKNGN